MAHFTIMHTCGHSEEVNLIGSHEYREWRIRRFKEEDCFDCRKQAEREAAKQVAAAYELPPLHGSEKQIEWAETLRVQKLQEMEIDLIHDRDASDPAMMLAIDILMQETSAHQWIEWRDDTIEDILIQICKTQAQPASAEQKDDMLQGTILAQATVRPEKPITEAVAEIHVGEREITMRFPEKREDFYELVRFQLGYRRIDGRWTRTIAGHHGTVEDRAAELGHRLLSAGFPVRIFREDIREKAISGDFAPEITRWIMKRVSGDYAGWFAIIWGHDEDYYDAAKKLKRSRYAKPAVVVPPEQFAEVLDFARLYDFCVSAAAQQIAGQAKAMRDAALVVQKAPVPPREKVVIPATPVPLAIPEDIAVLDEFREEL